MDVEAEAEDAVVENRQGKALDALYFILTPATG